MNIAEKYSPRGVWLIMVAAQTALTVHTGTWRIRIRRFTVCPLFRDKLREKWSLFYFDENLVYQHHLFMMNDRVDMCM